MSPPKIITHDNVSNFVPDGQTSDIITFYARWDDSLPREICRMTRQQWTDPNGPAIPRTPVLSWGQADPTAQDRTLTRVVLRELVKAAGAVLKSCPADPDETTEFEQAWTDLQLRMKQAEEMLKK